MVQYVYMDLQVHIEDDIVELVDGNNDSSRDDAYKGPSFIIIGENIGVTTLYVSSSSAWCKHIFSFVYINRFSSC